MKCRYETSNGRCGLKESYAYRHKCYGEDMCKCIEPMTNGDRIRAMTDEELAKALFGMQKELCRHIATAVGFPPEELDFADDAPDILNWLEQPAEKS